MSLKDAAACMTVMNRAGSKSSVVGTTERLHSRGGTSHGDIILPLSVGPIHS